MEEQKTQVVAPPEGQPVAPPQVDQGEGKATQLESALTRDEVLQMLKETEEKAVRRAQGLITKTNTAIRDEVTKLTEQLAKAGISLDDKQKAALEQQVAEQVLTGTSSQAGDQGQTPPPAVEPQVDPISLVAQRMMEEEGTIVYEDDPEAKMFENINDPYLFLKKLPEAIQAKKARLSASKVEGKMTNTPGVMETGKMTSPYAGRSGLDLISDYFKDKA